MTPPAPFDPTYLRLTTASESGDEVRLELHGFLDYDSADHFLAVATEQLADSPGLRVLHVDCAGMSGIDSTGLAMLLMLHRRTTAADVTLRLVGRPPPSNGCWTSRAPWSTSSPIGLPRPGAGPSPRTPSTAPRRRTASPPTRRATARTPWDRR